jgi:hypothetical protein
MLGWSRMSDVASSRNSILRESLILEAPKRTGCAGMYRLVNKLRGNVWRGSAGTACGLQNLFSLVLWAAAQIVPWEA